MCDFWHDGGSSGSAESDQKNRAMGSHHGACRHGLSTIHTESMGIIDALWRGNKDIDKHIGLLTKIDEKEWDLDVKHVEAHGN